MGIPREQPPGLGDTVAVHLLYEAKRKGVANLSSGRGEMADP
jgi:hypothetical protein